MTIVPGRTVTHWGVYDLQVRGSDIIDVQPWPRDPDPSPIGRSLKAVTQKRIAQPMVRRGWLQGGPDNGISRGTDDYVPFSWDGALNLAANELDRVAVSTATRRSMPARMAGQVRAASITPRARSTASWERSEATPDL
jgi:hypothetical protein